MAFLQITVQPDIWRGFQESKGPSEAKNQEEFDAEALSLTAFSRRRQSGRAIRFAVDHVFSSTQRASQVKNRIAVVVTDGKSQDDVVNVTLHADLKQDCPTELQQPEPDRRFCRWMLAWTPELRALQYLLLE